MKVSYFLVRPNVVPDTEPVLNNSPPINGWMHARMHARMDGCGLVYLSKKPHSRTCLIPFMVEHSVGDPEARSPNKARSYEA